MPTVTEAWLDAHRVDPAALADREGGRRSRVEIDLEPVRALLVRAGLPDHVTDRKASAQAALASVR